MSALSDWTADVHKRGGVVTRWPPNRAPASNAGKLAAHFVRGGVVRYELAPLSVRVTDTGAQVSDAIDIAKGNVANAITAPADALKKLGVLAAVALLVVLYLAVRDRA